MEWFLQQNWRIWLKTPIILVEQLPNILNDINRIIINRLMNRIIGQNPNLAKKAKMETDSENPQLFFFSWWKPSEFCNDPTPTAQSKMSEADKMVYRKDHPIDCFIFWKAFTF